MTVSVWAKIGVEATSGDKSAGAVVPYIAKGESGDDEFDVSAALASAVPATYGGYLLQEITQSQLGTELLWEAEARYGTEQQQQPTPKETGDSQYNFEIGTETAHITHSLETIQREGNPNDVWAPDLDGTIGETDDGVDGCDILTPTYHFSETHYVPQASINGSYKAALFNATGKTNNGSFKGFSAGEVLFLGATGSARGQDDWEITFRFAAQKNRTGLSVAGMTVDKKGWEYLWVRFREEEDPTAKLMTRKGKAVYVERVYEEADFSTLGIGT